MTPHKIYSTSGDVYECLESIRNEIKSVTIILYEKYLCFTRINGCCTNFFFRTGNVLADECLPLCYHGLRAKDKSFNATIKTDFDKDLSSVEGKINIIPEDIGRVILNLLTNAFYAVNEKKKSPIPKGE